MDESLNDAERKTDREEKQDEGEGPVKFPFPFPPYPIQEDFMKHLYEALDGGKIGIFESPTGTGKSLSLICGALKWLTDHEKQKQIELEAMMEQQQSEAHEQSNGTTQSSGAPDWVMEFESKRDQMEKTTKLMEEREKKLKREAKLDKLKNDLRQRSSFKRKRLSTTDETVGLDKELDEKDKRQGAGDTALGEEDDADDHLVADYHSDGDSAESEEDEEKDEMDEPEEITKIFYCSRTHSQLSQFVHEVQKSPYHDDVKVVTLGSRQNLCINEAVKKLRSMTLINDRCLEMQSKKKPAAKKEDDSTTKPKRKRSKQSIKACPHFSQGPLSLYKDRVAVEVMDMEQLGKVGKELKACPYYGTRYAVPNAQLVVLPYNILLHKSTRKACRINLKGNIVIIDEAHNLIETICSVHSVEVTGAQLCRAHSQLSQYMQKFKSRLLAKNLMYIKQLLQILSSWVRQLGGRTDSAPDSQKLSGSGSTSVFTINNFLFEAQMDNINLFKLQRYCQKSQISRKLNGFVERYQPPSVKVHQAEKPKGSGMTQFLHQISKRDQAPSQNHPSTPDKSGNAENVFSSPLMHIEGFLLALTNANKDGRVVVHRKELVSQCSLRFQLLNPAVHFTDVVKEARAIIVAGGTMQPVEEFKHQLFVCTGVQPERILEFSCGHVIPPEHLLPISLSKGPTGLELDFTYQHRDLPQMMDEVGRILVNISNIVPGGVVCFFPSYDYEKQIYQYWESHGVLTRLGHRKKIYREPRKANQVDQVLGQYSATIEKACSGCTLSGLNGAMLFCVVGGKMSEGINFSDNLGRCIVMVGLPYANIKSPELKEKMDYLNANMPQINGRSAGQVHYDNLCMKAVNQSIGRAIRHKGDYASMLLLDHRYTRPTIRSKLPAWISERLQVASRFGPAFASINKFFVDKRPDKLE